MDVEDRVGKRLEQRSADQPHEARQAHQPDIARFEELDDCRVVRRTIGIVAWIEAERLDAGLARAQQTRRVRTIRDDDRNRRVEIAGGDRVDDRLEIRSPSRDEDCEAAVHWV